MNTVKRFEDLEIWQKARILCHIIHKFTLKNDFSRDFKLVSQSKGSTGEIRSQLYRAHDIEYISEEEFQEAYNLAEEIGKMEGSFINYLQKSQIKGTKYKT
jgi:hypothetical protein